VDHVSDADLTVHMQHAWDTLGLAPTHDAIAIKHAYARALKRNRPDDDAVAYQALREAYDWAIAWARRQTIALETDETTVEDAGAGLGTSSATEVESRNARRSSDLETPVGGEPAVDPSPPVVHEAVVVPEPDTQPGRPEWLTPEDLAKSTYHYWKEHDDAALVALWPRLLAELDRVPLALRDEASNWFASFVLECPELPDEFLGRLARYFQWSTDFRADAALGAQRAQSINERLHAAGLLRATDPVVLNRYADVLTLNALLDRDRGARAIAFAALAPPKLIDRLEELASARARGLGITELERKTMEHTMTLAQGLRLLVLAGLLFVVAEAGAARDPWFNLVLALLGALGIAGVVGIATWLDRATGNFLRASESLAPFWDRVPGHRRLAASVALALGGLVLLAWNGWSSEPWIVLASLGSGLVALGLAWTRRAAWSGALLPVAVALAVGLHATLPAAASIVAPASIALAWTLIAHWLLLKKPTALALYRAPISAFFPTTAMGWIVLAVFFKGVFAFVCCVIVLALPMTYLVQATGFGLRVALATLGLGLAAGWMVENAAAAPAVALLIAPLVAASLQRVATSISRSRWLR
jgi:hypothetical protein